MKNAGKPIYAAFCAVAVFPPDRMSGCCPWRWIGTQGTPGISQTAPTLLLNTIRLLLHPQPQAHALPPTGSACPFDRRGMRTRSRPPLLPSHLCRTGGASANFFLLLLGIRPRVEHILCVCAAPALLSHPLVNPNHGSLSTLQWCNQHQWAQIFGAAGSSISAPFDLRSRPLPFLSPAHLVSLALGKGRSREIKVQKRKSFQSWH